MGSDGRLAQDQQLLIFNDDEPYEGEIPVVSSAAMVMINLITSAMEGEEESDPYIRKLISKKLSSKIVELAEMFKKSPFRKKDSMFWMSTVTQYVLNAYFSNSDDKIMEIMEIISSNPDIFMQKSEDVIESKIKRIEDSGVGDILVLHTNASDKPLKEIVDNDQVILNRKKRYSLAFQIMKSSKKGHIYDAYVYQDDGSTKVNVASLFGIISIDNKSVITLCSSRFRANVVLSFLLYIYGDSLENVSPYRMKAGVPVIDSAMQSEGKRAKKGKDRKGINKGLGK